MPYAVCVKYLSSQGWLVEIAYAPCGLPGQKDSQLTAHSSKLKPHCLTTSGLLWDPLPTAAGWQMCWRILQYTLGPTWCVRNYEFHNHFVNMRSTQDKLQPSKGLWSRRRRPAHFVGASLSCGELKIIWVVLVLCAGSIPLPKDLPLSLTSCRLLFAICHAGWQVFRLHSPDYGLIFSNYINMIKFVLILG